MTEHGKVLRTYADSKKLNKVKLAEALGMTQQNLYQLFASKEFKPATIKNIEKVLKVRWADLVSANIDTNVPRDTQISEPEETYGKQQSLEKSIENLTENGLKTTEIIAALSEDRIKSTAIIERLVTLLERQQTTSDYDPTLPRPGDPFVETGGKKKASTKAG